ncbi:pyridoxamine 5'-phosphate oxidase family protein [Enterococcus sp. LJL90]
MATLTQAMKDMIVAQLSFLATADKNGYPQVGPKGTMRVLDDNHLIYNEHTGKQAWQNVQDTHLAVVATVDHPAFKGFRFEGPVEIHQGDEIYEAAKEFAAAHKLPVPVAANVIAIEKIYKLDAGPEAGNLIEG